MSIFTITDAGMVRNDYLEEMKRERVQNHEKRKDLGLLPTRFSLDERIAPIIRHAEQIKLIRKDSNETNILANALKYILRATHRVIHPGDILEAACPVNFEGGAGLTSVAYEILDETGRFKLLGGTATDLPEVGSTQSEQQQKVGVYGAAIGWSQIDSERALRSNVSLAQRKAMAAMTAVKKTKNQIFWTGDPDNANINGVFSSVLNPVTIAGSWSTADAIDILRDSQKVVQATSVLTEEYDSSVFILDPDSWQYMSAMIEQSGGMSVGEYLMRNNGIKAILKTSYLNSVTSAINSLSADKVIMAYPRDPMIMEFSLPRDVQQFPFQQKGIQFSAPLLFDTAGALVYQPLALAFATGM